MDTVKIKLLKAQVFNGSVELPGTTLDVPAALAARWVREKVAAMEKDGSAKGDAGSASGKKDK